MSNYNQTLQTNNSSLEEIITQLNNMPDAGSADPVLQDKTVTPTTSQQTITADSGYDGLDTVTVNAMPTATQATPTITVNSSTGLITATATQTAGYVAAGSKSATSQMAFKAATTITPGTANQTAVAANTYVGGAITVKGDSNLVASNIVSGKSIFGVVGTATAGGNDPFAGSSPFSYTVNAVDGASYGFSLNSNGYYESQNKGKTSSYAICRINLTVTAICDIVFDVINYAENNYDYALFGNLDSTLTTSASADSNVKKSFKAEHSASVVNVTYSNVSVGNHTIDVKFIKDSSQDKNNDSVQFKIQQSGGLSQDTIDKILAADEDLVSSNIRSGVDIFGVIGTYIGGGSGGNTDVEDGLITRTITTYTNDRVTTIGSNAFLEYLNLIRVSFPAVITIGSSAFDSCQSLTSVSFPAATTIGNYAFYNCKSLTSVNFPKVTTIGNNAFESCSSLMSVSFPKVTVIGNYAFDSCTSFTSISFPVATGIGNSAFYNCKSLTSVNFPAATTIGNNAFYLCKSLTNVSFPVATNIGSYAFYSCQSLTSVNFPAVTTIERDAFNHCSKLASVNFPKVTTIGSNAFENCLRLTNVSFPKVTTIGVYAFNSCTSLTKIYLTNSSVCTLNNSNAFSNTGIWSNKGSIFVPTSLVASYKAASQWLFFSNRIFGV